MEDILLIGGGGHCKSCIDIIELEGKYQIAGIIDKEELIGKKVLGYEIIGCDGDLPKLFEKYQNAFITIGQIESNHLRVKVFKKLKAIGFKIPTIISPLSYVSKYSKIKEGTIVMHHSLINANVTVGKNCIINTKALIEHDSIIEDHCHISTSSVINGGTTIKVNSFIGSNSTAKEYTSISGFQKAGQVII